jgi:hypothetical protein
VVLPVALELHRLYQMNSSHLSLDPVSSKGRAPVHAYAFVAAAMVLAS